MKKFVYILLITGILHSCSTDDTVEPLISVDIKEGILGEWHVEWDCHRSHSWTFYEDGRFDLNFMGRTNTGGYSLVGRNLTVRGYNDIGGGEMSSTIMVLTPDRLELDDPSDWSIDYKFIRVCN
ncbi:hypothetical protein NE848_08260 [Gramella jeungdoensis]|uniref:Lipocalin-like domain-containing protein n=1 Tax=Gramella jeungdoensis TaxID=708091 RepID=A0ABT0Z3P2_9FLAO|nr:hypothetical protein [Gramella jeungdoensis]MCM8569369.1 hypothetical protein [Gramella jeungdoensis]